MDNQPGTITEAERARAAKFMARRPNFGAGVTTMMAAAIWQNFEDCYDRDLAVRLRAACWLRDEGAAFWAYVGLPEDRYQAALDEIMPASLRSMSTDDLTAHVLDLHITDFRAKMAEIRQGIDNDRQNSQLVYERKY